MEATKIVRPNKPDTITITGMTEEEATQLFRLVNYGSFDCDEKLTFNKRARFDVKKMNSLLWSLYNALKMVRSGSTGYDDI